MKTALALLAMISTLAIAQGSEERVAVQLIDDRFVPGRYPLTCADHDWDGMVGEILVE